MPFITKRKLSDILQESMMDDNKEMTLAWVRFFSDLIEGLPVFRSTSVTLNPSSVNANTTATETVTFNSITTNDLILVNKPTHTTGLTVTAFASADNTAKIIFTNNTGSGIDPGSEIYKLYAITI